jgi:hypothetical protein
LRLDFEIAGNDLPQELECGWSWAHGWTWDGSKRRLKTLDRVDL